MDAQRNISPCKTADRVRYQITLGRTRTIPVEGEPFGVLFGSSGAGPGAAPVASFLPPYQASVWGAIQSDRKEGPL